MKEEGKDKLLNPSTQILKILLEATIFYFRGFCDICLSRTHGQHTKSWNAPTSQCLYRQSFHFQLRQPDKTNVKGGLGEKVQGVGSTSIALQVAQPLELTLFP